MMTARSCPTASVRSSPLQCDPTDATAPALGSCSNEKRQVLEQPIPVSAAQNALFHNRSAPRTEILSIKLDMARLERPPPAGWLLETLTPCLGGGGSDACVNVFQ